MNSKMINKIKTILFIVIICLITTNITDAIDIDNYYKNLLKNNNIHYSVYSSDINIDDFPKNIITSKEEVKEIILENRFDNLIYICRYDLATNDCLSLFVPGKTFMDNSIEPITLYNEVKIYKYTTLNRNVYIVPEYILMSKLYSDYLYDYLSISATFTQTDYFDSTFYTSIIFEISVYLITLFIIFNFIYLSTEKRSVLLHIIKNIKNNFTNLSGILPLLLIIFLFFQPFIITIYKSLYNKSINIDTIKSLYLLTILSPRLETSIDLIIYFVQLVNISSILLLLIGILLPSIFKHLSNSKNYNKIIGLIIMVMILVVFFLFTSPKNKIKLFNEKNFLNKKYVLNENNIINDINYSKLNNLFIDSYLIFNNNFTTIKNTNIKNLNTINNNFYIIANDLNEYINTLFYLRNNNYQLYKKFISITSNINFYSNFSYDSKSEYFVDIRLTCKYNTHPFTFSVFIYTKDQIKANIHPEKLDFYNFSGCIAGEYINVRLPLKKFSLYNQDAFFVLRSREKESNSKIDTNGIDYSFEILRDDEILKKTAINYYTSKIIYRNLIQNTEKQLNIYSIKSNDFEIKHDDFSISNTINIMKNSGLINDTFYLWGN